MGYNDSKKSMPLDTTDVGKLVIIFDAVIFKDQSFAKKGFFLTFPLKKMIYSENLLGYIEC